MAVFDDLTDEMKAQHPHIKLFAEHSMDISYLIRQYMKNENIDRAELASRLEVTEHVIEAYLGGAHDFTLTSISMIEAALDIILIPVLEPNAI